VRLNSVVDSALYHKVVSICGDDPSQPPSYAGAMSAIGSLMATHATPGCLFHAPVNPDAAACNVTLPGNAPPLPSCSVSPGGGCWTLVTDPRCPMLRDPATGTSEQLRLEVRGFYPGLSVGASCLVYNDG
jgi:hypothetical protein